MRKVPRSAPSVQNLVAYECDDGRDGHGLFGLAQASDPGTSSAALRRCFVCACQWVVGLGVRRSRGAW